MKRIGSHVSISKGICELPIILKKLNADTCQIFTKAPLKYSKSKISENDIEKFKKLQNTNNNTNNTTTNLNNTGNKISCVVHGNYLTNLINLKQNTLENFYDDIEMTEKLNIKYYIFHPGSDVNKMGVTKSLVEMANQINKTLDKFSKVCLVVEIMAGQGSVLPYKLEHLKVIYDNIDKKYLNSHSNSNNSNLNTTSTNNTTNSNIGNKDRFGFCLDTCHMFASGYDFRTQHKYDNLISKIDNLIGLDTIKVIHLNDSKHPIGSRKDRHEHLGMGKIGIDAFRFFMEDERLDEKVFILETPSDEKYKEEIQILRDFLL